ncbi:MAG: hypothetical protein DRJ42_21905 [Deltaproteobacteria bacterium]|nr:MAG: hypothetical protein DRJ42_21905 [Deltaproteobacteria bacterium]
MQVPDVLLSLTDQGVIDQVLRPLKSGKEAQVYLVSADGEPCVAKVYKDAQHRSFKQRAQYMEGRRVRNTRDQRAMDRRTGHGKAQEEDAWKSAEVHVIQRLHAQGVRVPTPYNFIDGVLIMELVRGDDGDAAPRLGELSLDKETAHSYFQKLLGDVVKMLCAGIVHGDLSEYNVLVDAGGPVVIDFPQSVDAAQNRNAKKLLIRDVDNLSAFLSRCVPGTRRQPYGQEIWAAYESNTLTPDMDLTGQFKASTKGTNMGALLEEIEEAARLEQERRDALGDAAPRPRRREVIMSPTGGQKDRQGGRRRKGGSGGAPGRGGSGQAASGKGARGQGAGKSARGQSSDKSARGQGAGGRRQAGRGASPEEGRRSDGQRRAEDGRPAGRGDGRRRSEDSRTAQRGDGSQPANGDGAPKRRRRRRGRGGGGGAPGDQPEGGQTRQRSDGGRGQGSQRSDGRSDEGSRQTEGPSGQGNQRSEARRGQGRAGSSSVASRGETPRRPDAAADAPKSRTRRRRRRRKGPDAHAGDAPRADRAKTTRSDDAE